MFNSIKTGLILGTALLAASQVALADGGRWGAKYEVSITNLTLGQSFTPQLVTTHKGSVSLFTLGAPASEELGILAESGNPAPMGEALAAIGGNRVGDVQVNGALLTPGETATIEVGARRSTRRFSIAAMLIPTNDTFVGADGLALPRNGSRTYYLNAYDAGTEFNDQDCDRIPGPASVCSGEAISAPADSDEGFVYVSNGFHELGGDTLSPAQYGWLNPVAKVVVKRIH